MGVIKNLIGGIFGFLGGFFKGLLGLVGIGKKSEYFLELEDSGAKTAAPAKSAPAKPEVKTAPKAEPVKAETLNGKAPTPAPEPTPAPKPVVAASSEATQTFATDFLIAASSNSRRRPGPSLNRFMDMAKQVKPST